MKNIKFMIALFAAILMTVPTFAQHHDRDFRGPRGHGMKHVIDNLDLTGAQKEQTKTIREAYREKAEAIRNQDGEHADKREQMHQLREEKEAAFRNILTPEQIVKLDAAEAKREAKKQAFKERMKGIDKSGMKDEMKAYKTENIKPVLLEQRKKLESAISPADKAQIDELRAVLKTSKKEMKAKKEAHRAKGERPTKAEREQWKVMKEKYRPKHEQAKVLVEKYEAQITALFAEIENERDEWKEDMKGIKDKYFGDLKEEFGEHPRGERSKKRGKKGHHREERGHHKGDMDKIAFLLMDVEKAEKKATRKERKATALKVFPNPSTATNSIQYTVKEAGNIKIELHDKSGNVIREITNTYKQSGTYTETVNLDGLNGLVYFYVITDKNGVRSKKFMVKQ